MRTRKGHLQREGASIWLNHWEIAYSKAREGFAFVIVEIIGVLHMRKSSFGGKENSVKGS